MDGAGRDEGASGAGGGCGIGARVLCDDGAGSAVGYKVRSGKGCRIAAVLKRMASWIDGGKGPLTVEEEGWCLECGCSMCFRV